MRVMVLGLRAIPGVQGGVETHAEHLYPHLASLGCDIEVLVRSPYSRAGLRRHEGMQLTRVWTVRRPGMEALLHSFLGVLYAGVRRPDILHIHAVGPAIVTPIARAFGLRVIVTHHGFDYEREKWGAPARWVLRLGELFGVQASHRCISVSEAIGQQMREKYGVEVKAIPNGVARPTAGDSQAVSDFGLERGKYVLNVARMVPEKRQLDLIEAFEQSSQPGWKLVLVGALDETDGYGATVRARADANDKIVCAGFQTGDALKGLLANAGAFVLPSSHEGFPIAALEAMSYGLRVLASDIAANRELGLPASRYFAVGDRERLAELIGDVMATKPDCDEARASRRLVQENYDWAKIAHATLGVYQAAMSGPRERRRRTLGNGGA